MLITDVDPPDFAFLGASLRVHIFGPDDTANMSEGVERPAKRQRFFIDIPESPLPADSRDPDASLPNHPEPKEHDHGDVLEIRTVDRIPESSIRGRGGSGRGVAGR